MIKLFVFFTGWNDIGFHNPTVKTHNLDQLAADGVILDNSYVHPTCSPSRHAFMTGIYPFKSGLQRGAIIPGQAVCSPLENELLPQKLKKLGYATHVVGKWHLGFCNSDCTPTQRGFDSFLGIYNAQVDYYTKMVARGYDFRYNEEPLQNETYSTFIYSERARTVISTHNKSQPMFLYLPFQSPHSPIQVPEMYESMYSNITNEGRRKYLGMVSALDDAIGSVVDSLKENGLFDETVIIFTADNGGTPRQYGSNYPLRGSKWSVFEGGTRAVSFVSGAGLNVTGYAYEGLIHAVDWLPTILSMAGDTAEYDIDGISQWDAIKVNGEHQRDEFVYNLDTSILPLTGAGAIRYGDYKLIQGYPGPLQDYTQPDENEQLQLTETLFDDEMMIRKATLDIYGNSGWFGRSSERYSRRRLSRWGEQLYNLKDDPNETTDVSNDNPYIVKLLRNKLQRYKASVVAPHSLRPSLRSNPARFGGYWSPGWC